MSEHLFQAAWPHTDKQTHKRTDRQNRQNSLSLQNRI